PSEHRDSVRRRVDYEGVAALLATVVPLLLAFVWVDDQFAWFSAQFDLLIAASLIFLAVFVFVERHAAEPLMPPMLFRNGIFVSGATVSFFTGMAMFGATVYMPLFMVTV